MLIAMTVVVVLGRATLQPNSAALSPDPNITALSPAKIKFQSDKKQEEIPQITASPQISPQITSTPTVSPQVIASPQAKVQTSVAVKPVSKPQNTTKLAFRTTEAFKKYKPKYVIAWANATNYGERVSQDGNGKPVYNQPIVVLHETTASASSAVNTFQNFHDNDKDQTSYHTLIRLDGAVIYLVPPDKRAFGAGNSVFESPNGVETVQTNPNLPPSVNNFAYHVSLETPPDGWGTKESEHSGYTNSQYYSLAWLIAQSQVPNNRVTTHRAVDRSGQRIDPRTFDFDKFFNILNTYRQSTRGRGHTS
jgi:N-acetyl-anhydromuramyl-L-alanine amidase AmpD